MLYSMTYCYSYVAVEHTITRDASGTHDKLFCYIQSHSGDNARALCAKQLYIWLINVSIFEVDIFSNKNLKNHLLNY